MKVAILTTDSREHFKDYNRSEPYFGTAPAALVEGLSGLITEDKFYIISCTQKKMVSSSQISRNIWFHSLYVPKWGWLRSGYLGCTLAVRKKLHEIQPDLVHAQGTERDCAISAVLSGYPNVVTIHGNMTAISKKYFPQIFGYYWFAAKFEDFALKRCGGVLCNSDYTQDQVRHRTIRTWRVDNPVRSAFFHSPRSPAVAKLPRLLVIGSIVPWKRPLELLRMAASIQRLGVALEVRFIGSCGEGHYAEQFLQEIGIAQGEGYARYLGSLDLPALLQEMDAASGLVHFPNEEAFGLVVAEGLARNLKLFGARVGGIPGIVEGVKGAELFEGDDFVSLEEAIVRWVAAGATRLNDGMEMMSVRFHPNLIARRHLEIYHEVLAK